MKKIETEKFVSRTKKITKEEWLIKRGSLAYYGYHREDGPALIEYYNDGTIKSERWFNNSELSRPIEEGPAYTEYYENGKIKYMHWEDKHVKENKSISYYENGNIKEKIIYGPNGQYLYNGYKIEYYENGNIKYERRWDIDENSSLVKPVIIEYDINGNILKEKYYIYGRYITKAQLDKYNKQLQSKRKLRTLNPETLDILYYLAKKYGYKDKIEQIEELLIINKLN